MSITQSIQEAIKQNLPAAVASELSTFIEQAGKDAKALSEAKSALATVADELAKAKLENQKLADNLKAYRDLEAREKAVADKENKLAVTVAELNRDRSLDMANQIYKLAEIAFRNPRLVHSENGTQPVSGGANPNAYPNSISYNKNSTIEETK